MLEYTVRSEACHVMLPLHLDLLSLVDLKLLVASMKAPIARPFNMHQVCGQDKHAARNQLCQKHC